MNLRSVFPTSFFEQQRTVKSLLDESKADSSFYTFLIASAFITSLGLVADSLLVIIGGMLVAPLLFPILSLGMSLSTSSGTGILRALGTIWRASAIVVTVAFLTSFLFHDGSITEQMQLIGTSDLLFFLTAFAAGVVAAFAWIKENLGSTLPGVAVAVALLPPLALVGVSLSLFSHEVLVGSLTIYLINLLGIVLGSMIVFSLFGFARLQRVEEKRIHEEVLEQKVQQTAREEGAEKERERTLEGEQQQ